MYSQLIETQQPGHSSQAQHQNDSWFWENETSSTSSKKDDTGSPCEEAEIDLTNVPLDSNDHEVMEKLRRQAADHSARLKVLGAENKVLTEKLKIANAENEELNRSIEELDQQHQIAIEKILEVKKKLQDKLSDTQEEIKLFQQQKSELLASHADAIAAITAEKAALQTQLDDQTAGHRELTEIAKKYEQQVEELSESNLALEAEVGELRAAANDAPEVIVNNDESLKKIAALLNSNFKLNEAFESESQFVDAFAKWSGATSARMRELDFEISKLIDENKLVKEESAKHVTERAVLKNELAHFEVECSELMKNNNILLADLECLKGGGKLETILENDDEENIVVLERQLEDSNSLNQSLEDDFHSIRSKLEETEVERSEYFDEIQQLKNQLADNVSRCKVYQQEIDNLENEKSNYLFELNELKSEEERNILQKELKTYKTREVELMAKLAEVEKEHAALNEKFKALEKISTNQMEDLSACQSKAFEENNKLLNEKDSQLVEALAELERLRNEKNELSALEASKLELSTEIEKSQAAMKASQDEIASLKLRCDELLKTSDANLENLQKSNALVQDLQAKLLESNSAEELAAKITSLEETLAGLAKEKENLIALVTTKHNENVQYHNEIVRLNQLLQQESQNADSANAAALEAANDQVTFLREKCDLLAQNLLQEQNSLRLLQQEKNDAVELNSTLNKDIERLRQHLLEVADAYTFEQVSLQKQVEEYKSKLMAIESEAKQSATAYTSANIRANQQAETLQTQYTLLTQQRDELLAKLSNAEDVDNKNQAALTNLQVALEIFQKGKALNSLKLSFFS